MKSAVFVHDHVFAFNANGQYFSEGKITDAVFARYLKFSDEVKVISRARRVDDTARLVPVSDAKVYFRPVKGAQFSRVFSVYFLKNAMMVGRIISAADLVVLRLPSFLGLFAFLFVVVLRKKYFVEFVGHPKDALLSIRSPNLLLHVFASFMSALNRVAVKYATGVIYVTQGALQAEYPTHGFCAEASNVELKIGENIWSESDYAVKNEIPVIGLIGSFNNAYKGIDVAIRAIAELKGKGCLCCLRVLGSGDSSAYMSLSADLRVSDLIHFDGVRRAGSEVYEWLDNVDIYIQPSRTEGLPRSLIEAMSRALPCVASDAGGMSELLSSEWIFVSEKSHELAERIQSLITSSSLRRTVGQRNYLESCNYDANVLSQKRENFWRRAADEVFKA